MLTARQRLSSGACSKQFTRPSRQLWRRLSSPRPFLPKIGTTTLVVSPACFSTSPWYLAATSVSARPRHTGKLDLLGDDFNDVSYGPLYLAVTCPVLGRLRSSRSRISLGDDFGNKFPSVCSTLLCSTADTCSYPSTGMENFTRFPREGGLGSCSWSTADTRTHTSVCKFGEFHAFLREGDLGP